MVFQKRRKGMILSFEKELSGWYIVLPEWTGSKADLAMVAGADTLLDNLSNQSTRVSIDLSLSRQEQDQIHLVKKRNCFFNGADYEVASTGHKLWLCNVTLFVLGHFPQNLYIKVINQ
jgi:hypothetical protein